MKAPLGPPRRPKLDARTADYVQFFTTDSLRREWRAMSLTDDRTTLRGDITISRADLEAEIRWRVWWERFGYSALMTASLVAAVAAVVGAVAAVIAAGGAATLGGGAAQPGGKITLRGIWLPYVLGGGIVAAGLLFWCRTQQLLLYGVIEVIVGLTLMVLASQVQGAFSTAFSDSFDTVRTALTVTTYLGGVFATVRGFDNIKTAVCAAVRR